MSQKNIGTNREPFSKVVQGGVVGGGHDNMFDALLMHEVATTNEECNVCMSFSS